MRVRRRPPREPWRLSRVASWSLLAVAGDPAMLLVPAMGLAALTIAVFGLGAPGRPEVLVPIFAAPPADAFQDAGIIGLVPRSDAATWSARAGLVAARAVLYGLVAALAIQRARGEAASIGTAARRVLKRAPALGGLAALAMGFALTVSGGGEIAAGREAGVAGTALVAGMLLFPAAFVASIADDRGLLGALRRSGRWFVRRPLGHVLVVAGYALAFGGTIRLALFGEVAGPRALPVTLYAFVAAFVTTAFTAALARRYVVLYSDEALAPSRAARAERRLARLARRGATRRPEPAKPPRRARAKRPAGDAPKRSSRSAQDEGSKKSSKQTQAARPRQAAAAKLASGAQASEPGSRATTSAAHRRGGPKASRGKASRARRAAGSSSEGRRSPR